MKVEDSHLIRWPDEHKQRPAILALAHTARAEMADGNAGAGDESVRASTKSCPEGSVAPRKRSYSPIRSSTSVLKAECVSALKVDQFMAAGANIVVVPRTVAEALDGTPPDLRISDLSCPEPCLYLAFQDSPFEWMDVHGEPSVIEGCYVAAGKRDFSAAPDNGWEHLSLYFMVRPIKGAAWPMRAATGMMLSLNRADPETNVSDVIDREVDRLVAEIRAIALRRHPTAILQQNEQRYVDGSVRAKRALMTIIGALHALTIEPPAEPELGAQVSKRLRRALQSEDANVRRAARAELADEGFVSLLVLDRIPEPCKPPSP